MYVASRFEVHGWTMKAICFGVWDHPAATLAVPCRDTLGHSQAQRHGCRETLTRSQQYIDHHQVRYNGITCWYILTGEYLGRTQSCVWSHGMKQVQVGNQDLVPENWTTTRLMASAKWRWTVFFGLKSSKWTVQKKDEARTFMNQKPMQSMVSNYLHLLCVTACCFNRKNWKSMAMTWHLMSATCTNDTVFWGKAFSSAQWIGLTSSQHNEALRRSQGKALRPNTVHVA